MYNQFHFHGRWLWNNLQLKSDGPEAAIFLHCRKKQVTGGIENVQSGTCNSIPFSRSRATLNLPSSRCHPPNSRRSDKVKGPTKIERRVNAVMNNCIGTAWSRSLKSKTSPTNAREGGHPWLSLSNGTSESFCSLGQGILAAELRSSFSWDSVTTCRVTECCRRTRDVIRSSPVTSNQWGKVYFEEDLSCEAVPARHRAESHALFLHPKNPVPTFVISLTSQP